MLLERIIAVVLARVRDPNPERNVASELARVSRSLERSEGEAQGTLPGGQVISPAARRAAGDARSRIEGEAGGGKIRDSFAGSRRPTMWGWLPIVALLSTLGLFSVVCTFESARAGAGWVDMVFLPGVVIIFVPSLVRQLGPWPSRFERIGLVCVVGVCLYLVKVCASPLSFSSFDEFLHWRTAEDIARSGHLFTGNALLPVSAYYPGLEVVTNALGTLSGLSTPEAGMVVIGVARLVMVLSLFMLNEQILGSARMAGIATMIYMTNPHFLFFDAQFGYESLALPLATFVLFVMAPHQMISVRLGRLQPLAPMMRFAQAGGVRLKGNLRWITLSAWIVLGAVTMTHHVTSFFLDGLLLCWTVVYGFLRLTPLWRSNLTKTALLGVVLSISCIAEIGNPVVGYISSFLGRALDELGHVLTGTGSARQLFVSYTGQVTPLWERVLPISAVALILMCFPWGFLCLWWRYRLNALTCMFGVVSLAYPLSQLFRLTNTGAELTDRSAAFLFLPIATVLAIFITQFWPVRRLNWKNMTLISIALSIVFLGGVVLGAGPSLSELPGPYLVGDDGRSIEGEGREAAMWTLWHLGPDNRIATDRTNQVLMATYGEQRVVTDIEDAIDVSPIFFSATPGPQEVALLRRSRARYVVVDLRLARELPVLGYYFVETEAGAFHRRVPVEMSALTKFSAMPQMDRVFDSGDIVIYGVGGLTNEAEGP
jgi:hypothetical protein